MGHVVEFGCSILISAAVFEPSVDAQAAPEKRLEDMMRLGELCMEVLQQNDEHHSEVFFTLLLIKLWNNLVTIS